LFLFFLPSLTNFSSMGDLPDTDDIISVSGKEGLTISRPGERDASRSLSSLSNRHFRAKLIYDALAFEIPDLDAGFGGSAKPVPVGAENKGVDDVTSIKGIEVLPFVEIPKHGDPVLSSGSAKRAVWGNGDGVNVSSVPDVIGPELAVGEVPDFDKLVPASGDDDGVGGVGGEADAGHPLGMTVLGDGVFAFSQGVPELDGLITGSGDDLAVVG